MMVRSAEDLYVWHACLDAAPVIVRALESILATDELTRAKRFRFEHEKRRFIVARGILRSILGASLRVEPSRLRFRYSDRGKPFLADDFERENVFFNVAHSQGHGLFAVAAREVGVDIEVIRPTPNAVAISDRFFSPRERSVIRALPTRFRQMAFFHCWTRKEAYLKGLGEGLAYPLDRFDVTVTPGQPARLLRASEDQNGSTAWQLHDLSQLPTYAAAVAVKGPARIHVRSCDNRFQRR